jgi:protein-S-isoprenylcysteine O-methyltransferase Ste14
LHGEPEDKACSDGYPRPAMDPWIAKGVVLAATVAMIAIRAPHGHRSRTVPVKRSARGVAEAVLLTFAWLGFLVPIVWIASGAFDFAEFPLAPAPLAAGAALFVAGLWLFHRSHADLGTNWSITLQIREGHRLVTGGVYRRIRHPMYSALFLYAIGQALSAPNWIAGPCYLAVMVPLVLMRLGPEEAMMRARFGAEWDAYAARTGRLIP